ncbi:MAG: bactofilin family protein [Acidobacteriota bacterium]
MWKKPDMPESTPEPSFTPRTPVEPVRNDREKATIGPSISIKGDLVGEEDLVIQGRVEGKVELKQHNVTIGRNGRVKADVYGKIITVEGEVQGNLFADEKIIVRQAGSVRGNLTAPKVSLEEGSIFKGAIDMDSSKGEKQRSFTDTASEGRASKANPELKDDEAHKKISTGLASPSPKV